MPHDLICSQHPQQGTFEKCTSNAHNIEKCLLERLGLGNTLSATNPPPVTDWGWEIVPEEERLTFKWTLHTQIPEKLMLAHIIKTCKCNQTKAKCLN